MNCFRWKVCMCLLWPAGDDREIIIKSAVQMNIRISMEQNLLITKCSSNVNWCGGVTAVILVCNVPNFKRCSQDSFQGVKYKLIIYIERSSFTIKPNFAKLVCFKHSQKKNTYPESSVLINFIRIYELLICCFQCDLWRTRRF